MRDSKDEKRSLASGRTILLGASVSLTLSAACVVLLVYFTGGRSIWHDLLRLGLGTVVTTVSMVAASWAIDALRLMVLASTMGGRVSFWDALKITVMGAFMAGVTPFDTGGEPLKIYFLHKRGMSIGQATAAVALSAMLHATTRFLLWVIMPLLAFALGLSWTFSPAVKATLTLGLGVYVFFMILLALSTLWPDAVVNAVSRICEHSLVKRLVRRDAVERITARVRTAAIDFREGILRFRNNGIQATIALALSFFYWIAVISVPVFLLKRLGSDASTLQAFYLSMTVYLIMAYVPTPGASGGAEVGSAIFFSQVMPARLVGTFVVAWRFLTYYLTLIVGGGLVALETFAWSLRRTWDCL